jgi:hypothetical protein
MTSHSKPVGACTLVKPSQVLQDMIRQVRNKEAAQAERRAAEENLARARAVEDAASSGYLLDDALRRVDRRLEALVMAASLTGVKAEMNVLDAYKECKRREKALIIASGMSAAERKEIASEVRMQILCRFFKACMDEIKKRDDKSGYDTVADHRMFRSLVNELMKVHCSIYGSNATMSLRRQSVVSCMETAKAVLKGGQVVIHAPMQSGKTCVAAIIEILASLMEMPCFTVVAASVQSVNQAVKGKIPSFLERFSVKAERLTPKVKERMTDDEKEDVRCGQLSLVAHWNALKCVNAVIADLELKNVIMVLDESDDLISNVQDDEDGLQVLDPTDKEEELANFLNSGTMHCTVSLSATQLAWLRLLKSLNLKIESYIASDREKLARLRYRGIDAVEPPKYEGGSPCWIPEKPVRADYGSKAEFDEACDEYPFNHNNLYGIYSEEVKGLFFVFNASRTPYRTMLMSLGPKVKDGFVKQAEVVMKELSPNAVVIMLVGGGVYEFTKDSEGHVSHTKAKNGVRNASIGQVLEKYDNNPETPVVILSQGCAKRGQSICTPRRSINFAALFATEGMNIADLLQLLGRVCGRRFVGRVIALMRKSDYEAVMLLDEFTRIAVTVMMRGDDFLNCDELSAIEFKPLLDMFRPFNRKRVIDDMPENTERMKRRMEEVGDSDESDWDPEDTDDSDDEPDPAQPGPSRRALVKWEIVLLSLRDTVCYKEDGVMTTGEVQDVAEPLLMERGLVWSNRGFIADLKEKGFIEKRHGEVKLTPEGKAEIDALYVRA